MGSAARTVDGITYVIEELRPGMSATLAYGSPGSTAEVLLLGHTVTFTEGDVTFSRDVQWVLPGLSLAPGETYVAWLAGDLVEVLKSG